MRTIKYFDMGLILTKHEDGKLYNVSRETITEVGLIDVIKNLTTNSRRDKAEYFVAWSGLKYQRVSIVNVLARLGFTYLDGATKKDLRVGTFRGRFTEGKCFYLQVKTAKDGYVTLQAVETVIGAKKPAENEKELRDMLELYHYTRDTFLSGLKRSETRVLYSSSSISRTMYNRTNKQWNFAEGNFKRSYVYIGGKKIKKNIFIEDFCRPGVHGGFNAMSEKAYKYNGGGIVLDANSLYPFVSVSKILPSTELLYAGKGTPPVKYIRHKASFYTFMKVTVSATLKEDGVACILADNALFNDSHYLTSMTKRTLTLSEADRALLFENYNITYYRIKYYMIFRTSKMDFVRYIQPMYDKKSTSTGIERNFYKSMLVGLIGTFAKQVYKDEYYLDMDNGYYILKKRPIAEEDYRKERLNCSGLVYVNMAIVSEARKYIISFIKKNRDRWLYTDTDSIHLIGKEIPQNISVSDKLGDFKIEHDFTECKYITEKKYFLVENNKVIPTIAGLPKDTFETVLKCPGIDTEYITKALKHHDFNKLLSKPIGVYRIIEDVDTQTINYEVQKTWISRPDFSKKEKKREDAEKRQQGWEWYSSTKINESLYDKYGYDGKLKHFIGKWNRAVEDKVLEKPTFEQAVDYLRKKLKSS